MEFEDCIGLNANEAINRLKAQHPYLKITVHLTLAPRHKGNVNLSEAMVVRQRYDQGVLELAVVMVE